MAMTAMMLRATAGLLTLLFLAAGPAAAADEGADLLEQFLGRKYESVVKPLEIPEGTPPSEALFLYLNRGYGDAGVIGDFLAKGADVNVTDNKGYTPLHYAVGLGHEEFVRLFLARGADTSIRNDRGLPPGNWRRSAASNRLWNC